MVLGGGSRGVQNSPCGGRRPGSHPSGHVQETVYYLDLQFRREELAGGKIVGTVTLKTLTELTGEKRTPQDMAESLPPGCKDHDIN